MSDQLFMFGGVPIVTQSLKPEFAEERDVADREGDPGSPSVWSPCRRFRYVLWRKWASGPYLMVVGLNPSTADDEADDPTLRRCIGFAKREGMGALCMANVYAYRSTDPKGLRQLGLPLAAGQDNGRWLAACAKQAGAVICAWGKHAARNDVQAVSAILRANNTRVMCLGTNKDGSPKHPLYLPADAALVSFGSVG